MSASNVRKLSTQFDRVNAAKLLALLGAVNATYAASETLASESGKIVAELAGAGPSFQLKLTLTAVPVTCANVTGASFGSLKLFDFNPGRLLVQGTICALGFTWTGTGISATGSGDYSLGTTATADATLATTDVDLLPSTAMTDPAVLGVAAATEGALAASAQFDGRTTAKDMYLNIIIDNAAVADADSSVVLVTGTIVMTLINLGD